MKERKGVPSTAAERWEGPSGIAWGILFVSVVAIVASVAAGRAFDLLDLIYDLGVGVGFAAVVSIIVSTHLKNLDKLHKARHDAIQNQLEHTEGQLEEDEDLRKRRLD